MLLSVPPRGTRPGVEQEWTEICAWAGRIGLALEDVDQRSLSYETPAFEHNALGADGIFAVPRVWRRAPCARFRRKAGPLGPRPPAPMSVPWAEYDIRGTRIRVKPSGPRAFLDPALQPVSSADVFASVSRRDPLRREADVWTSGNRVFRCPGRFVLRHILGAMVNGMPPHETVALGLGRPLRAQERDAVDHASRNVEVLCIREWLERERVGANEDEYLVERHVGRRPAVGGRRR